MATSRAELGTRVLLSGMASVSLAGGMLAAPAPASAATNAQAAFYTYQAPEGAWTAGRKVIALTFDDGPSIYTPQVLAVLARYHVPATFFEVGQEVAAYPQYTRALYQAGDPVEDHTWGHADLVDIPISQYPYQIDQTQNEIRSVIGVTPNCVRPPYDDFNSTVLSQIAARNLTTMSYSVAPSDWTLPGTQTIVQGVVSAAFPGAVVDLHDGGGNRQETVDALPAIITQLQAQGYTFVSVCGYLSPPPPPPPLPPPPQQSATFAFGSAIAPGSPIMSNLPLAGLAVTADSRGYWLDAADGGVFTFGTAAFHGSLGNVHIAAPVVGIAADRLTGGYWQAAADGGVFSFSAPFFGSAAARKLNKPVVGMAATADGKGYWLVASDGGVFTFGDAGFFGSAGAWKLKQPVVGIAATADGKGYWLVASDGGVFTFGDAGFHGSAGAWKLNRPVVGIAASPATGGYWLAAADGGVFSFGAPFYGSRGGLNASYDFFAIGTARAGAGYLLAGEHDA